MARTETVSILEAKTRFSELLARVMRGEEIVIVRDGLPVARLVPDPVPERCRRVPGIDKGKLWIADDFDAISDTEIELWHGTSAQA